MTPFSSANSSTWIWVWPLRITAPSSASAQSSRVQRLWTNSSKELNKQFKKQGISRIEHGAIVDASIVDSPHAPDGSILIAVADDREDLRTREEQTQEEAYHYELKSRKPGVDTEARWVRKRSRYRYGYKKHVLIDNQGLVEALITRPANCSDMVCYPI